MIQQTGEDIWRVTGPQNGPCFVLLGGIHGNEATGIRIVERLRDAFRDNTLSLTRGELFLIIGNPRAREENRRYTADGKDLNRLFSKELLEEASRESYEESRAQELAPLLAKADISLDLHATNKPSVPFLSCALTEKHRRIYQWLRTDRLLLDPRYVIGGSPVTTDEYVDLHGGIGLCYETGNASDISRTDEVYEDVLNILRDQQMINGTPSRTPESAQELYELTKSLILDERGFSYADDFGTGSFQSYQSGDTIGFHGTEPLIAKEAGVIVFPKIPEHWKLGQPIGYLAKRLS